MNKEHTYIFFNAYYFQNGYGLSGGDKRVIELLRRWTVDGKSGFIVLAPGKVFEILKKENITAFKGIITSSDHSQKKNVISAYITHTRNAMRYIRSVCHGSHDKDSGVKSILYTTSDFVPDIIPAAYGRIHMENSKWYAIIHHIIEDYHTRPGRKFHNWLAYIEQRWCIRKIIRYADKILTVSPLVYDYLIGKGVSESRLELVSNGVDTAVIESQKPFTELSRQYDGIFVARFARSKGIFEFPDIWKRVADSIPGARLCLIGEGTPDVVQQLKEQFAEKGIEDLVSIPGFVPGDELYSWLKSARVCLFPSHEEGWGISIAEAMDCGLPVVTYDLPVFPKIFHNINLSGPVGDTTTFADNVIMLLQNDNMREEIGRKGKQLVDQNYTWDRVAEREWDILHEA